MGVVYPELPPIHWRNIHSFLVGLTGGIGSGKSAAGRFFAEAGATVADADLIARDVLHSPELRVPLRAEFGPAVFDEHGEVSRPAIAEIVFQAPERLQRLNAMIHPLVRKNFDRRRKSLPDGTVMVYDVPLLFENIPHEQFREFDLTMVVTAPLEVRYARVHARSGWPRDEFERREASQMPLLEKEQRADFVITNDGTEQQLQTAVRALYAAIVQAGPAAGAKQQ